MIVLLTVGVVAQKNGQTFQAVGPVSRNWRLRRVAADSPVWRETALPAAVEQAGGGSSGDMGSGWGSNITVTQNASRLTVEYGSSRAATCSRR